MDVLAAIKHTAGIHCDGGINADYNQPGMATWRATVHATAEMSLPEKPPEALRCPSAKQESPRTDSLRVVEVQNSRKHFPKRGPCFRMLT
jgi:hypothetical protein